MNKEITKTEGFVSQRDFQRYMADYDKNAKVDDRFVDPVSRSLMASGREKGDRGEFVVKGILEDLGYEVKHLGGTDSRDLDVKVDGQWKRMEVKTSQYLKTNNYKFNAIKPWLFDMIAFVFVSENGTSVKIGGKGGQHFVEVYGSLCSRVDCEEMFYNVALNKYRGHTGLYGTERMLEVDVTEQGKANMKKISKDL